jgi:hypothetical protein
MSSVEMMQLQLLLDLASCQRPNPNPTAGLFNASDRSPIHTICFYLCQIPAFKAPDSGFYFNSIRAFSRPSIHRFRNRAAR